MNAQDLRATAEGWSDDNPFRQKLLARLGGLHQSPPTDHLTDAEEARINRARETEEVRTTPSPEFKFDDEAT